MKIKDEPKRWYQDWLGWTIFLSITYGFICLLSLASDVGRPFPGFLTYHNAINNRMEMEWNIPAWWWRTTDEHPRLDDILIRVNETPFAGLAQPVKESSFYQDIWDQGQKSIRMTVQRNGRLLTFPVPLEIFSWFHYADLMLMPVLVAASYWLLAIILYRADSSTNAQRLIVLILCAMAVLAAAVRGSLFIFGSWRENTLLFINPIHSIAATFIGALLIHLAFQFPFPRWPRLQRLLLPYAYGLVSLLYIFFLAAKLIIWHSGITPLAHWLDEVWFNTFQTIIIMGISFILVRMLGEAFFLPDKSRERQEARLLLLAFLLFLPTVWFAIHGLSGTNTSILFLQSLADTRLLALVVPFALAAISLRYHTFAGAERWLFLALAVAVSGFLANVGTAVLFWQSPHLIHDLPFPPTAVLFLLFLFISLIWGWQASWRGWLGRVFQWERINYQVVQNVGQRLLAASPFNEAEVAQLIATTLCQELEVERTAVWLHFSDHLQLVAQTGRWQAAPAANLPLLANRPLQALRWPETDPTWQEPFTDEITAVLPLIIADELLGVVFVGPRWDTAVFDDRDMEILTLNSQQAAYFLQNARQNNQLRQADQQILSALTHARQKTAQDLHDHLLPALSRLQLDLLTAVQQAKEQPAQVQQTLTRSQQDLAASGDLVRRIQQDLVARPLQHGLQPYLINMVQRFREETGIIVQQTLPSDLDNLIQDIQLRETLYAIWQQALDNVQRHAQASHLTISLTLTKNRGCFEICDNGQGSSPETRQQAIQAGHFGLRSMQIRLEEVDGRLQFQSSPGQGSCISGRFPLKKLSTSARHRAYGLN